MLSVLLSVYDQEQPEHLRSALESIWDHQTLRPDEIVLVKDGPLTAGLNEVISRFGEHAPLKVVALEQNRGLGIALALGLEQCSHDLVARMDSDDISKPERFARQVALMRSRPSLAICGSHIAEFLEQPEAVVSVRRLPESHEKISQFARKRNPLNHMSVMFRKSAVLTAGNYHPFLGYEDYYLWIRMLQGGAQMANLPEELVYARVGNNMFARRHGWRFFVQELKLQRQLLRIGFLNGVEYLRNLFLRALPRLFPVWGLRLVYKYLRK